MPLRASAIRKPAGWLVVAFSLLAGACGSTRVDPGPDALRLRRAEFARTANQQYEAGLETMRQRMEIEFAAQAGDASFDVLVLHGGGIAAAFSAGFLAGWAQVRDPALARPEFDLVTGSSTGALIAPFALVGDEASYAEIFGIFCDFPTDVFRGFSPTSLWPTRGGLFDQEPLARFVRNAIGKDHVEAVARGADEHRMLLVVTTDLDLGLGRVWNLGREVQRARQNGVDRFHLILKGTSAVPLLFPPVEIDGALHNDGAVSGSLVLGFGLRGIERIADAWGRQNGGRKLPKIRVWVIMNQPLFAAAQTIQPRYPDVVTRSLEIALEYDRHRALRYLAHLVARIDARDDIDAEFRWTSIPASVRLPRELTEFGDSAVMRDLAELGARMGADPASWRMGEPEVEFLPEEFEPLSPPGSVTGYCPAPPAEDAQP
jgi:predicted acylesterase/phospholipase RssA